MIVLIGPLVGMATCKQTFVSGFCFPPQGSLTQKQWTTFMTIFSPVQLCRPNLGRKVRTVTCTQQNIHITLLLFLLSSMSWSKTCETSSVHTKGLFLSKFGYKFVEICVSENFSFGEIIHPPDRCGIQRCWLNCRITAQVCSFAIKLSLLL